VPVDAADAPIDPTVPTNVPVDPAITADTAALGSAVLGSAPLGSRANPRSRRAGRVLLIDAQDRVLLLRGADPGRIGSRYWFTVGGGADADETLAQAAARELHEECGLLVDPAQLGEPVVDDLTEFPYRGIWYRQEQQLFVLRIPDWEVPVERLDPEHLEDIDEHRWWSVEEIEATQEEVYPPHLATILRGILER
jgi:8-oxo-dGTP pyrophosphatase MutT (NUDIX family)